jgi:hypothetical protein
MTQEKAREEYHKYQVGTMEVESIWDYGKDTYDRYTVCIKGFSGDCLCLSDNPTHPMGFSQWNTLKQRPGKYLGKRITFESLPKHIQDHINARLQEV